MREAGICNDKRAPGIAAQAGIVVCLHVCVLSSPFILGASLHLSQLGALARITQERAQPPSRCSPYYR